MLTAMIAACGLWGVSWCLGDRLASAWGFAAVRADAAAGLDRSEYDAAAHPDCDSDAGHAGDAVQQPAASLSAAAFLHGVGGRPGGNQPELQLRVNAGNGKTTLRRVYHQCVGIFSKELPERSSIGAKRGT